MTSHAHNPLKNLLSRNESKDTSSLRYTISVFSALLFLGWLILELTLGQ